MRAYSEKTVNQMKRDFNKIWTLGMAAFDAEKADKADKPKAAKVQRRQSGSPSGA